MCDCCCKSKNLVGAPARDVRELSPLIRQQIQSPGGRWHDTVEGDVRAREREEERKRFRQPGEETER